MTLAQLRYLVAIADAGLNITVAAERLHATQPHLSRQLKQLEDELGFQLFVRRGRSLEAIAPSGGRVLEHARRVLAEVANIRAYAANERGQQTGQLILVTTHTQARFVLPPAIARINQEFPHVTVHLEPTGDGEVLEQVAQGQVDMAIISTAGSSPNEGIVVPLYRWRRVVLVPRNHALAKLDRAPTLAELAKYPLVSYESSQRADSSLRGTFQQAGLDPQLAMTARDADLIKTYVRAGLGVGVLAEMAVGMADDDLKALAAPSSLPECIAWAVIPRARVLRDYAVELLHALAPQLDRRDLRRVVEGNQVADWPPPPGWLELTQSITS